MNRGGFSRGAALNVRWGARFAPPKAGTTKIRLIPGKYVGFDGLEYDFFQYVSYFSARTKKGFLSGAKWEMENGNLVKVSGNCLGYDEWQKEIEEGIPKAERTVSMRIMHAYTVLHLEWYHETPALDERNRPKKYEKGPKAGQTIMDRVLCQGRRCDYCRDGVEKVFGRRLHWSMGSGHLTELAGIRKEIEKDCVNCGGEGTIEEISYDCAKCGKIIVDVDQFDLSKEGDRDDMNAIICAPYACKCGHTDYLVCQHECSGCQDPTPLSIFDCDVDIKTVGEGTKSSVQIPRWTQTELSKELREMAKPLDLAQIFTGDPLDIQAKYLRVSNPYGSGSGREDRSADADKHSGSYDKEEEAPRGRRGRRSNTEDNERDSADYDK